MRFITSVSFLVILCVSAELPAQGCCHPIKEKGSTDHNEVIPEDPYTRTCGNVPYNISENLCCNEVLIRGLSNLVADCCKSNVYNPLNEICCNGKIRILSHFKEKCCGSDTYLETTHVCCGNKTAPRNSSSNKKLCPGSEWANNRIQNKQEKNFSDSGATNTKSTKASVLKCGSHLYDPLTHMCCSGKLYRSTPLHKCCGVKTYQLSDKVLCCNGILYKNLPEKSHCVGGFIYVENQIMMTCGSEIYNSSTSRCCSGQLHDITNRGKTECCGKLLVEKGNTCCSSKNHAMLYETKLHHDCCGHQYYNTSLWSCCAEHLKPTPSESNHTGTSKQNQHRLMPLTELIPHMCNKTVVFGKVESVMLKKSVHHVSLKVYKKSRLSQPESLCVESLDHCSSPALEIGETYLWQETTRYTPVSFPIGQASDIETFFTLCGMICE